MVTKFGLYEKQTISLENIFYEKSTLLKNFVFTSANVCFSYTVFISHGNSPHIEGFPPKWIAGPPKMAGESS